MKINFKHYLMYMFSTVLIVSLLHNLISIRYVLQYIEGGIKQADKEYFNKTVPFVIMKLEVLKILNIISINIFEARASFINYNSLCTDFLFNNFCLWL